MYTASEYRIRVLTLRAVSQLFVAMKASEPAIREMSGNWKMLTVSLTLSGSLVWKQRPRSRTETDYVILRDLCINKWNLQPQMETLWSKRGYFVLFRNNHVFLNYCIISYQRMDFYRVETMDLRILRWN